LNLFEQRIATPLGLRACGFGGTTRRLSAPPRPTRQRYERRLARTQAPGSGFEPG
jgi:hypothetical protein